MRRFKVGDKVVGVRLLSVDWVDEAYRRDINKIMTVLKVLPAYYVTDAVNNVWLEKELIPLKESFKSLKLCRRP